MESAITQAENIIKSHSQKIRQQALADAIKKNYTAFRNALPPEEDVMIYLDDGFKKLPKDNPIMEAVNWVRKMGGIVYFLSAERMDNPKYFEGDDDVIGA